LSLASIEVNAGEIEEDAGEALRLEERIVAASEIELKSLDRLESALYGAL
jgi:hypothetical protein